MNGSKLCRLYGTIGTFCIIFVLCITLCITSDASECFHWYCKRTQDHTQPSIDSHMSWITEHGGAYVDKDHGDPCQEKVIYLTFDAGYENGNVAKILDILQEHQIKGAFFILGNLINRNPELVQRMADEGHLVCNHTYTHKNIATMSDADIINEIDRLENAYTSLTGKQMAKYFRPPEGSFDQESIKAVYNHGYKTVFWSFAYADWDNNKQMTASQAKKKIMDNLHNGEIMLLHPTSKTNAEILSEVISDLKAMGYHFASLDELEFDVP